MPKPRLDATSRYRLLATVCTCSDRSCPCHQARSRADGTLHCPLCRTGAPTLVVDLRGAELRGHCTAGCDQEQIDALLDGGDGPLLTLYGSDLSPSHARLLLDSAIAPHVAAARPYSTMIRAAGLERLGFGKSQRNVPALVIPISNVHGERATYQARPDMPRVKDGKPLKYETPAKSRMSLDVPPAARAQLGNPAVPLFISEGARKADAAVSIGLCCISLLGVWNWRGTNDWGGKAALPDWEVIAFKDVNGAGRDGFITFDSDVMLKPAVSLALSRLKPFLESRGAVVRAIYLPSAEGGTKMGLDDFLAAGQTIDDLLALATDTLREPAFERQRDDREDGDARPEVEADIVDLPRILALTWAALDRTNRPPTLFRFGGVLARIEEGEDAVPSARALDNDRTFFELGQRIRWVHLKEVDGETVSVATLPPSHVIRGVLATPQPPLPILSRIVEAPGFTSDGTIQATPGYQIAGRSLYVPAPGFEVPEIPACPTDADLKRARRLLADDLLGDFPFVGPSERAHAIALLLLPFVRELIGGPTPLHLIEKPTPGTGASLLVDVLTFPALGHTIAAMTEGRDEDEWRKRLTAKLATGSPFVPIDNLRRPLDSAAMAAAITTTRWEDRLLGVSQIVRLPVRCAWLATGNNPVLSNEITRRTVRIRLDANHDQPWLRDEFRHPDLRAWVREHRADLVWAALVMGRAWVASGQPSGQVRLGMFEEWAAAIGGILGTAGIDGFLGNLQAFYAASDLERSVWQAFLGGWWERHGSAGVGVADLFDIALATEPTLELGDRGERSQRTRLGKLIGSVRDHRFRIKPAGCAAFVVAVMPAADVHNASRWRLRPVDVANVDERFPAPISPAGWVEDSSDQSRDTASPTGPDGENVRHVPHVHQIPLEAHEGLGVSVSASAGPSAALADEWGEV